MKTIIKSVLLFAAVFLLSTQYAWAAGIVESTVTVQGRVITVAGKIVLEADEEETPQLPTAFLSVVNTDCSEDRRAGFRYVDSQSCQEDGGFSFQFYAPDGGTYRILVSDLTRSCFEQQEIMMSDREITMTAGGFSGGTGTVVVTVPDTTGLGTGRFTIGYDPQKLTPNTENAVVGNEKIKIEDVKKGLASITCTYSVSQSSDALAVAQLRFAVAKGADKGTCMITVPECRVFDRFKEEVSAVYPSQCEMELVSGDAYEEAVKAAETALTALPEEDAVVNEIYDETTAKVREAQEAIAKAEGLGAVAEKVFAEELLRNLAAVKSKLLELKPEMDLLAKVNGAQSGQLLSVLLEHNGVFGIAEHTLKWLETLPNQKEAENGILKQTYYRTQKVKAGVEEQVFLYAVQVTSYGSMEKLIQELDVSNMVPVNGAYSALPSGQQDYVKKAVAKKTFDSMTEFVDAFSAAVLSAPSQTTTGNGGGRSVSSSLRPGKESPVVEISDDKNIQPEIEPAGNQPSSLMFSDLEGYEWAVAGIEDLAKQGIASGDPDGRFRPGDSVTRAEFVKLLVLTCGLYDENLHCTFADVPEDAWFYIYVASGVEAGLVSGINQEYFGADETLSRQDMAVLLMRALELDGKEIASQTVAFADFPAVADYAQTAVEKVCTVGLMNGIGDDRFDPEGTANRAMAAKVLFVLAQR